MKFSKLAHFGSNILRMHVQPGYRVPLSMHVVLTNRCNLTCTYCRTHDLPQKDIWTTKALKKTITQMKECGTRRIHFTGGEPLLRDDIGQLIDHAKHEGIFVSFVSNGTYVPKRINDIKNADVVFISYDGIPEAHAQVRGKRSVEEVLAAIKTLKEAGINVWMTSVLTQLNAHRVDEIVAFARQQNIKVNFTRLEFFKEPPYHLHPLMEDVEDLILKGEARQKIFHRLLELKKKGAPIASTSEYLQNAEEWPFDDKIYDTEPSKRYDCWAGRAYGHLESNGMLYSCGTGVSRIRGVNVLEEGFQKAWEKLPLLENCRSCSHACGVESNLIFSLNPSAVLNWVKATASPK